MSCPEKAVQGSFCHPWFAQGSNIANFGPCSGTKKDNERATTGLQVNGEDYVMLLLREPIVT